MTTAPVRADAPPDALGLLASKGAAERALTTALAAFQEQVAPIASFHLADVVEAAKPAFSQGLAFSAQLLQQQGRRKLRVTVMHTSGAEVSSEDWADDIEQPLQAAGWMLAMLLGIPAAKQAQACEPGPAADTPPEGDSSPPEQSSGLHVVPHLAPADEVGDGVPAGDAEADANGNGLDPLSNEEIIGLHRQILALSPGARKELTQAFREHFEVPRSARSIGDRITQRRHATFLNRCLAELEPTSGPAALEQEAA